MKNQLLIIIFFVFIESSCAIAGMGNSSENKDTSKNLCEEKYLLEDSALLQKIKKSLLEDPSIDFVPSVEACLHNRFISDAINRTFFFDIFDVTTEHSYSKLIKGEDPFSVDIFTLQDTQTAKEVEKTIQKRKINNLQIQSPIFYSFFTVDNHLIIFLADRLSYRANKSLFKRIEQVFSK